MFANPLACLQVAQAEGLNVLAVVVNNAEWGAVRKGVEVLYPDGHAVRANRVPLTDLSPSPDFAVAAQACGAWGRRVDTCDDFETALAEAAAYVREGRGAAVIDARVARH